MTQHISSHAISIAALANRSIPNQQFSHFHYGNYRPLEYHQCSTNPGNQELWPRKAIIALYLGRTSSVANSCSIATQTSRVSPDKRCPFYTQYNTKKVNDHLVHALQW